MAGSPPHPGATDGNLAPIAIGAPSAVATVPPPIIAVVNVTVTAGSNLALGTMSTIPTSVLATTAVAGPKGLVGTAVVSTTGGAARIVPVMVGSPTIDSKTGHRPGSIFKK